MFQTKEQARAYLQSVKPYINISGVSRKFKIARNLLSLFIKDAAYNYCISLERINVVCEFIANL